MNALREAQVHVVKAREFLEAAQVTLEYGLSNAATSDAVIAGVNAKDAICLCLTGRTAKSDDHRAAVTELRKAGAEGLQASKDLAYLLTVKQRSQYQAASISLADATKAVVRAGRLVAAAERVLPR